MTFERYSDWTTKLIMYILTMCLPLPVIDTTEAVVFNQDIFSCLDTQNYKSNE